MSSAILRQRSIAISFIPYRRDREISKSLRILRIRASRRRFKKTLRNLIT